MKPFTLLASAIFCFAASATVKVGDPAPEIHLDSLLPSRPPADGTLATLRGKAVVIEFWATWCAPCVAEIPHLNRLVDQFKDRPIQFLSITDEEPAVVEKFLAKRSISGWVGFDKKRSSFKAYGVHGIPHTVLIDAGGKIAAITHPEHIKANHLEDLLEGKPVTLPAIPSPAPFFSRSDKESGPGPLLDIIIRPTTSLEGSGARISGTKLEASGMTLSSLLYSAYGISRERILGEAAADPSRYDVYAAVPGGKPGDLTTLLRNVLPGAFRVKINRETRETDVWILKAPNGKPDALQISATSGSRSSSSRGVLKVTGGSLSGLASSVQSALNENVVDETGLTDRYDYELAWDHNNPKSILDSVKQFGLSVERGRRPVEFLLVEKVN